VTGPIPVVGGTGVFGRRLVCGLVATTDLDVIVAARERSVVGAPGLYLFVEALALAHRRRDLEPLAQRTFERLDAESGRAWAEHRAGRGWSADDNPIPAHRFWVTAIGMAARCGATGEPVGIVNLTESR